MMLARRLEERFEPRVTWIFGSPRSGSTWLRVMLSELDPIVTINEPQIGFYLGPFACDAPGVRAADLDKSNFTLRRIQANYDHQFFANNYRDVWAPSLRRLINERFWAQARRTKPRVPMRKIVVVVKEPNGSQSADMIMSVQPKARLLFLLRDGRDVVDSLVAAGEEGAWPSDHLPGIVGVPPDERLDLAVTSACKWLWQIEIVQDAFAAHKGPKMLLRYEDLRAEPEQRMRDVTRWLGVQISDNELRALVERHSFERIPESNRGRKKFFRSASPGQWRNNLTPAERESVHEILAPKLRELGYEA